MAAVHKITQTNRYNYILSVLLMGALKSAEDVKFVGLTTDLYLCKLHALINVYIGMVNYKSTPCMHLAGLQSLIKHC